MLSLSNVESVFNVLKFHETSNNLYLKLLNFSKIDCAICNFHKSLIYKLIFNESQVCLFLYLISRINAFF